jgi:hypothetical protein
MQYNNASCKGSRKLSYRVRPAGRADGFFQLNLAALHQPRPSDRSDARALRDVN